MTQAAFSAIIFGRVQLVMYRDFARRKAQKLGITGEVKNLADGTVSIIAEGSKESLDSFIMSLKEGSLLAKVENVSIAWTEPTGAYESFSISY